MRKYPAFGYQVDVTRLSKLEESEFCCQGSAKLSAGSKTGPNSDVAEAKNGLGAECWGQVRSCLLPRLSRGDKKRKKQANSEIQMAGREEMQEIK